jgi:hypothetical protein
MGITAKTGVARLMLPLRVVAGAPERRWVMRYGFGIGLALALGLALMVGCSDENGEGGSGGTAGTGGMAGGGGIDTIEWAASIAVTSEEKPYEHYGFRIGVSSSAHANIDWLTDGALDDYKPVYSPDGSQVTFFRVYEYLGEPVPEWRSKICVMNADGSGYRELTSGEYSDYIPYWTRDGSNDITFTRVAIPFSQRIYRTSPDAAPGEEELISDPENFEHGYSTLEDGRMLIRRELPFSYFLMTPNLGGTPSYEPLSYSGDEGTYLHKMTVSPSETKVAYMKVEGLTLADILAQRVYLPAVIAYADFDPVNLRIENEVEITEFDDSTLVWYPAWTADEKHILYAHSFDGRGVIKAYSLEAGTTTQISSRDDELDYRYPVPVGIAK